MKKLLITIFTILILSVSYSQATFSLNDVKYVSAQTASEMWDVKININERTGIIELIHNDKTIFMQLGRELVKQKNEVNRLFMNIEGYLFEGEKNINGYPFILDGILYLPSEAIYNLVHEENEYDIIVVGCEPEAIASAVSAARMGAKVLLIGQEETPGGLLVLGMLNTIDMNWDGNTLLTQGIFEEFYDYVGRTESFDVNRAAKFFNELIKNESNITYLKNIDIFKPILEGNIIKGIEIDEGQSKKIYYSKIVIDATKDGDVCALAGVPFYKGMEDINVHDTYMAVTLVFKLKGVDWDILKQDIIRYQKETGDMNSGINESTAWAFGKWCYANYKAIDDNIKLRGLNIGRQEDGTILINALQILGVDGLDKVAVEEAKKRGEREIENSLAYLKTKLKSFEKAEIAGIADELYIRETRHIKGEYTVKASELLEGVIFEDAIAAGSYPIDIQTTSMNDSGYVIGVPDCYTVPYRSTVPLKIDNLYIVGKAASYSSVAAGSIRVVPVGMVVGESVGISSIYAIKNDMMPRQIIGNEQAIKEIRRTIVERGGYLPEYKTPTKIVETNYYDAFLKFLDLGLLPGGYNNEFGMKNEITQTQFINFAFRALERSIVNIDIEKARERIQDDFSDEILTYQKLSEILFKIKGKNINQEKVYEQAFKSGIFTGIKEEISKDKKVTKEIAYKIMYEFLK